METCWNCKYSTDAHKHRKVASGSRSWCDKKGTLINKAGRACLAYQSKEEAIDCPKRISR